MSERATRSMYYIEGSAVKKIQTEDYYVQPEERPERRVVHPERIKEERQPDKKAVRKLDKALAFDFKYTAFVVASVLIMVCACVTMLYWESRIESQKGNINKLEGQLEAIETDNASYKMNIDNMYTLDQIYDAAKNELGMVYARKGQIVYYESANEDYVKQYQDVPSAN